MVGVTVAVGSPYTDIAHLAAACFTARTGLPAIVLGDVEFAQSGLPHPAALRLLAFQYVNADRLVYFDADWFCLRPWSPSMRNDDDLQACRDFILMDEFPNQHYEFDSPIFREEPPESFPPGTELRLELLRSVAEFAALGLPYSQWINTGLMILSRRCHELWFKEALDLYLGRVGHHPELFEQPALNAAMESLGLRARLMPRCLNVLAAFEATWPNSVVGLHVKMKRHGEFVARVRDGNICTPDELTDYFTSTTYERQD
jgi:hypothetical protein